MKYSVAVAIFALVGLLVDEGSAMAARQSRRHRPRGDRPNRGRRPPPSRGGAEDDDGDEMIVEKVLRGMKDEFTAGSLAYTCVDEANGNEEEAARCWSCFQDAMEQDMGPEAYTECGNNYLKQSFDGCSDEISAFAAGDTSSEDGEDKGLTVLKCFNRLSNRRALEGCQNEVDTSLPLNEQLKALSKCRWGVVFGNFETMKKIMKEGGDSRRKGRGGRSRGRKHAKKDGGSELEDLMKRHWATLTVMGHCDSKQESEEDRKSCYECFDQVKRVGGMDTRAGLDKAKQCTEDFLNVDETYDYSECTDPIDSFAVPPTKEEKGLLHICFMGKMEEQLIDESVDQAGDGSIVDQFVNVERAMQQTKMDYVKNSDISCFAKLVFEESMKMHEI